MKSAATRRMRRCLALRIVPCCLPQPKMHSIAARLRHTIAFVPRGAFVDGTLAAFAGFADAIVLRHMRCDVAGAKIRHMLARVIGLVHDLRGAALGDAISLSNHAGHRQPMSVLHGGVAHIGEFCLPPSGLAVKTTVGVARTRMRVVLALLSVEVCTAAAAVLDGENSSVKPRPRSAFRPPKNARPITAVLPADGSEAGS